MFSVADLNRKYYPNTPPLWDEAAFRERVLRHIKSEQTVLDLGAGRGCRPLMNFRGLAVHVCGVDPEPSVLTNPYLDEAKVGYAETLAWPDDSFDLVYSANVLEHLPDPLPVFREVNRVLKSGGLFLTKTPSRWHYVQVIARLMPEWFHEWIFRRVYRLPEQDKFPAVYRANTFGQQRELALAAGFEVLSFEAIEDRPGYLHFSAWAHLCGIAWERAVNSAEFLAPFRAVLISVFKKPEGLG